MEEDRNERLMNAVQWTLVLMALILAAWVGFATGAWSVDHAKPTPCYEDQPCWDCHRMGNRICGTER